MADLIDFGGKRPAIADDAFVAPGARLIGDVAIGPLSSIWYNCVLRGDLNRIVIGARSNIQDGSVVHVDPPGSGVGGRETIIGDDVLIGHMAMLHGCRLHDRAFVGLGSIVMDGCTIEPDGMLGAGSLLSPGKTIGTGELWLGRPARKLRLLTPEEIAANGRGAARYVALAKAHQAAIRA